jgi:hypothetical protein
MFNKYFSMTECMHKDHIFAKINKGGAEVELGELSSSCP